MLQSDDGCNTVNNTVYSYSNFGVLIFFSTCVAAPASGYVQIIYANLCTKLQLRARRGVVILQAPQVWVTSGQQIVLVLLDDPYLRRRNYHEEYSHDNWDVISRNFRYWMCYLLFFFGRSSNL